MGVHLQTAPATDSLPGRVFAVVQERDSVRAIYEFLVRDAGRVELEHVASVDEDNADDEIPDEVRESLSASGYTIVDGEARADGGTARDGVSRRDLLRAGVGAAAIPALATSTSRAGAAEGSPLPAPFDEVPAVEDPTDAQRRVAAINYPPAARPEDGPIPDVHHMHRVDVTVTVPRWALEAARWRMSHVDRTTADSYRGKAEEILLEYAQAYEQFVTPDGRDAVDVVLQEADDGGEGGD
jgi:hypothetical protein